MLVVQPNYTRREILFTCRSRSLNVLKAGQATSVKIKHGMVVNEKIAKHGGSLDRRGLIRGLHIDHLTFRRIVMTLHICDAIIEESEYGKNTVYTLKDAA